MNIAEFVFAAIDVLFHPFQNYIKVDGITKIKDVAYATDDDLQKMDFYYKKSADKLPIIVNIHGGGFVKGDKKHRESLANLYADRGWFVINANYRLAPKYAFPAPIEDMFELLSKIPDIAKEYNLDTDRIVITGDSSGAYTSVYVAGAIFNKSLRGQLGLKDLEVKPAGVAALCGIYDVVTAMSKKLPFGLTRSVGSSYLGMKLNRDFSNVKDFKYLDIMSPVQFVNEDWCPTFISYAEKDFLCGGHGEIIIDKFKSVGVPVYERHSTKFMDNHCYHFNFWTKASKDTMAGLYAYLEMVKNKEFDKPTEVID